MKHNVIYSTMLVELDTIFDTRLSLLNSISKDLATKAINSGYFERDIDEFPDISFEEFRDIYSKRDKRILQHTIITPVATMLYEFVTTTLDQMAVTPSNLKPKIVVNLYPYNLTDIEINSVLRGVVALTRQLCDIETIYMPYEGLTPNYVKSNYSMMVLYEYYKWLEINSEGNNFKKTTCPGVALLAPGLYFSPKPTKEFEVDPFKSMETVASLFIGLKFLNVDNYCFIRRHKK